MKISKRAGAVVLLAASVATVGSLAPAADAPTGADGFTQIQQTRVFDSGRISGDALLGAGEDQVINPNATKELVPAGATAVEIQITAASETSESGDLDVHPDAKFTPGSTSNLNYVKGVSITTSTVAQLAADGTFRVYNHAGTAGDLRLIVDILGYYAPTATYTPPTTLTSGAANVALPKIGGSWSTGHTDVQDFTAPAGTYLVNLSGDFYKTATTPATPDLQIQLNGGSAQITGYTGAFPYNANEATGVGSDGTPNGLEQTATAVGTITLTQTTTLEIDAFGYNADRSGDGGGDFAVTASVTLVPVNPAS